MYSPFPRTSRQHPDGFLRGLLGLVLLAGAPAVPATDDPDDPDAAMAGKLAGYVDCINEHSNWTLQSRDRYFSWLKSPEAGPTGREMVVYGVYELHDTADCRSEITRAASLPPDDPELERAAEAYIAALEATAAVVAEADNYYELQNYKDDDMREGKALHPRLVSAYEAFDAANDELYGRVIALKDAAAARRVERLAGDESRRADYVAERLLLEAKRIVDSADAIGTPEFDRAAYQGAVQRYEAAYREFEEYRKANPDHAADIIRDSSVAKAAFELLKTAKATMRREREGFRFDESERILIDANAPQMVDGHPVKLVPAYNELIDWSNRARR